MATINHIEIYVENLEKALPFWNWLFKLLECPSYQEWKKVGKSEPGKSWWIGSTYLSITQTADAYVASKTGRSFSRLGAGLNHLAFEVPSLEVLDTFEDELQSKNMPLIFRGRIPHPGESDRELLEFEANDPQGLKIELVFKTK